MKKILNFDLLIPLLVAGAFGLLNLFGFYQKGESRIYDLLLHIRPAVPEQESILLLDIDDLAIAKVGVWPWSRDIMADGLILMKEFEAAYAVFDIEYTEPSPLGVNADLLNDEIPEVFQREFLTLDQNITDLFQALQAGSVPLAEAGVYIRDLSGLTEQSKRLLLDQVAGIARDNDAYLGQAAHFFEHAYFTVNMLDEPEDATSEEAKAYVLQQIPLQKVTVKGEFPFNAIDIRPAIQPVIQGGGGAGFPNVYVDEDGVRRRINLVMGYQDRYFPQLAFAPLLHWLGNPGIIVGKDRIILQDVRHPEGQPGDIKIPLAEDGRILINWPKRPYLDSFRHMTYYELVLHKRLERNLLHNLKIMAEAGYLAYYQGESGLLDPYRYAEALKQEILQGGDPQGMVDYRQARGFFFAELELFLKGEAEQNILEEIDTLLAAEEIPESLKGEYRAIRRQVTEVFSATREIFGNLARSRAKLKEQLPGSFCIIGHIGTSTTDIGVNPFEKKYMNVGTHAALANTILNASFLDDLPWWYAALLGTVLSLGVTLIIRRLDPLPSILVGIAVLALLLAGGIGLFLLTGIYLNLLTPVLTVFFTNFVLTVVKFLLLEREKSFLRNAFSHYLSTDVINELLADPEKLNLGGEKKHLTAIFTDIKGFSTISEKLDPSDLVRLLNAYLTEMSNIILELRGTIDKYEGDAIISFFGAPVEYREHARNACLSAVRMKHVEQELNRLFQDNNLSPLPLHTRVGINTGEMVVGNMGTSQKMDYTIMGNSVNLAARLEGVNKQYGTWILISESTYQEGGEDFTIRKLDRVRVVGIQEPVRLYELIDEKSNTPAQVKGMVERFHQGLDLFEGKEWDRALAAFQEVLEVMPGDGPSEVYVKRCRKYKRAAPGESWDGVFNLTMK